MRPGLVASDIDGTLLGVDERVSPRTARSVAAVVAAEVPFVLVTGRPPRWVGPVAQDAGLSGFAVCANGAVLYDIAADEVVWRRDIDPVRLGDLAGVVDRALPGCTFAAERVGRSSSDDVAPFVAEASYLHPWPNTDHSRVAWSEVVARPAVKLLVRHSKMTSAAMAEGVLALLGDEFSVTFSSNSGLVEIAEKGVTKATGLADVVERLDVPQDRVIAFGDMPNDVEMLRWAGHGVAMGNAHPEVREAADEITATHAEDGVAQVLERWFPGS